MLKNRTYPMRQPAGSYQQMPRSGQATSGLNRSTQDTGHFSRFIDFWPTRRLLQAREW